VLFSVIIPTYNRARFLARALDSVFAQTFKDYEVIVVDDGSTDETQRYLKSLKTRISSLKQPNRGPGAARNVGAKYAKGEYLAFLDSDDIWFPWALRCFAELIRRYNRPAVLGAKLVQFSAEGELAAVRQSELEADEFADYLSSYGRDYFVGAGMSVLRRDEFLKTGGFTDQRINAEDHDLILRMGAARGFVQMTSPVTLGWRRHAGTATTNLHRSVHGALYLVEQERRGAYPGGRGRAPGRRDIIAIHTRPVTLSCLRQGLRSEAWALYRATFAWNAVLGRFKYLGGFPLLAVKSKFCTSLTTTVHPILRCK
jgi:Glycosyl transferase family 2